MKPPALPAPPIILHPPTSCPLRSPTSGLRAVLRGLPQVVSDVPPPLFVQRSRKSRSRRCRAHGRAPGQRPRLQPRSGVRRPPLRRLRDWPRPPVPCAHLRSAGYLVPATSRSRRSPGQLQRQRNHRSRRNTCISGTYHAGSSTSRRHLRRLRRARHLPHRAGNPLADSEYPQPAGRSNNRLPSRQLRHGRNRMPRQAARWNHRGRSGLRRCILHRCAGRQIESRDGRRKPQPAGRPHHHPGSRVDSVVSSADRHSTIEIRQAIRADHGPRLRCRRRADRRRKTWLPARHGVVMILLDCRGPRAPPPMATSPSAPGRRTGRDPAPHPRRAPAGTPI